MNLQEQIFSWLLLILMIIALIFANLPIKRNINCKEYTSDSVRVIVAISFWTFLIYWIMGKPIKEALYVNLFSIFLLCIFCFLIVLVYLMCKSYPSKLDTLVIIVSFGLIIIFTINCIIPFIMNTPKWVWYLIYLISTICNNFVLLYVILMTYRTKSKICPPPFISIISFGCAYLVYFIYILLKINHESMIIIISTLLNTSLAFLYQIVLGWYKIFKLAK